MAENQDLQRIVQTCEECKTVLGVADNQMLVAECKYRIKKKKKNISTSRPMSIFNAIIQYSLTKYLSDFFQMHYWCFFSY